MEDHQKKLEIMEKYYQKIGTNFSFKLPDEITRKQLDNAKAKFARGLEEETILGFYDTTVLGSGKNGFIFTDSKMYFLETLEKPKKIWYDDIQNIEIYNQHKKDHDRVLEIILENGDTIEITSSFVNKTPLFEFLNELLILEKGNEQVTGQVYDINQEVPYNWADLAGYGVGNRDIVNKVYDEEKFHARQGHGFAAERANNLYDRLHGHDAQIIGDDNSLNDADGILNGIEIQSKYCKTGSTGVKLFGFEDSIDLLFKDPEIEGKKRGYERVAKEYEKAFQRIKNEYETTKRITERQMASYNRQADVLIERLSELERQEKSLKKQIARNCNAVSDKYDIPNSYVSGMIGGASVLLVPSWGLLLGYKKRKFHEAEQQGYLEAKKVYDTKIAKLKNDLSVPKNQGNLKIKKLLNMIDEILDVIVEEQMKIAELKILLAGDRYE